MKMNLRSHSPKSSCTKRSAEGDLQEKGILATPSAKVKRGMAVKPTPGARAACVRCHDKHLACPNIHDGANVCTPCIEAKEVCVPRYSRMGQQPHMRKGVKSFHIDLQINGYVEAAVTRFFSGLFENPFGSAGGLSPSGGSAYGNSLELNFRADKMLRNEFALNVPDTQDVNGKGTVRRYRYGDGSGSRTIGTNAS